MINIPHKLLKKIESRLDCKILSKSVIGNGEHNFNFLLNTNKGAFVLRIYANHQFDNSKKEYEILKKLNGRYAPKVYFLDSSKSYFKFNYIVQEFVEGTTLNKFSNEDLKELTRILKEIHKIRNMRLKRMWKEPLGSWIKLNLFKNSKVLGEKFNSEMKELYYLVKEKIEMIRPLMKRYDRTHLIHDDLVPENVIKTKENKLVLIDWEFATYDYFFFEFGCLIGENHLNKIQERVVLNEYGFGLNKKEKEILHVIKIKRILALITWLIERISAIKKGKKICLEGNILKYQTKLKKEVKYIKELLSKKTK